METVYLVDGSSFLYRFYFAMKGLSYNGFPTSSIFGFAKLLLDIENLHPSYIGFFFDTKAKTFREDMLESYKKNRPKTPDDLLVQIEPSKKLIEAFGITIIELDGFEADDLIATYAEKLKENNKITIIASDKDLFQLVDKNILLYDPVKKITYDREGVFKKLGCYPEQVADYLALVGDSIDNIPGVKSIGPKTAASLLLKFGSIEGILKHIDKLPPKTKKALENEPNIELYRKLTTVDRNAPIEVNLNLLKKKEPDYNKIREIFMEFGFKSLLKALPDNPETAPIPLDQSIIFPKDNTAYIYKNSKTSPIILGDINEEINCVYDFKKLDRLGITFKHYPFDIKLACYLINADSKGNPFDCFDLIDTNLSKTIASLNKPEEIYAVSCRPLKEIIEKRNLTYLLSDVETPLSVILNEMEKRGILIDSDHLIKLKNEFENTLAQIEEKIYAIAQEKFNINSTKELQRILFEKLKIKPVKKTKTGYSTDSESLSILSEKYEIAALLINYRTITKVITTYIVPFLEKIDNSGRIHTTFNQTLTATGRLSSSNPNLQNLPAGDDEIHAGIRKAVIAPDGYKLICSDYSQIELRVLAHMSKDPALIEIFNNNQDIHTQTAVKLFGVHPGMVDHNLRRMAKTINFGILYGMGYVSLAKTLSISKDKAKSIIETYFNRFSKVKEYIESTISFATKKGYVETLFGRRRYLLNINSKNKRIAEFEKRAAVNTTIQGTAADIIKIAMVKLHKKLKDFDAYMVLQVHDELLIEAKDSIAEEIASVVKETMESVVDFDVPLKTNTKIASNWYDAK